jgi:site-specific DNA-cytosine methylase
LLDASKMGVPQKRERVFFIAMRKDLAEPFLYQQDMFTVNPLLRLDFNEPEIPYKEIRQTQGNESAIGLSKMISHYWKLTTPGNAMSENHPKGSYFNEVKTAPDKVLPTIRANGLPYDYEIERTLFDDETKKTQQLMINNYQLNVNNLMLTALGNIQGTPESKFFSVNFKSDVRFENDTDKIAFYPNFAEIMIEDTNNIRNTIKISNTSNYKALISAYADGITVTGFPKTVEWDELN